MTYQNPTPAPTSKPLNTAIIALVVVMAMTLAALGAVMILGGTSDAASTAPAQPAAAQTIVATEINEALDKEDPAVIQAQADAAAAEQAAQADAAAALAAADTQAAEEAPAPATETAQAAPAEAQAAPAEAQAAPAEAQAAPAEAAPVQAAPAPRDFHPTCGTSKSHVVVGETFIISGTTTPPHVQVNWAFDHGDGFVDRRNPSHAYYQQAGTYTVIGLAEASYGELKRVHCGIVTVTAPFTPEFHCTIDNPYIPVNGNTVFRAYSNVQDDSVVYTFHHGDGYSEVANPSYATYYAAGTYNVSVTADYDGILTHVDCGTVTVSAPSVPTCPSSSLIGMTEADADAAVFAQNCTPVTVVRDFSVFPVTGEYVNDRVQLTVLAGFVVGATVG